MLKVIAQQKPFQGNDYFNNLGWGESGYAPVTTQLLRAVSNTKAEDMLQFKRVAVALAERGIEVIRVPPAAAGGLDLGATLAALAERGLTRLLVEGGAQLAAGLVRAGLVDRVEWFRAPTLIGGDGTPALAALGIDQPDQAPRFDRLASRRAGDDLVETLVRRVGG